MRDITSRVNPVWEQVRACLQREKDHIYGEIRNYPTPIAGCDQQFNALLERRTAVAAELARLQAAEAESLAAEDGVGVVERFIQASQCLEARDKELLAQQLRDG